MVIGVIDHWYYVKTEITRDNFFLTKIISTLKMKL